MNFTIYLYILHQFLNADLRAFSLHVESLKLRN